VTASSAPPTRAQRAALTVLRVAPAGFLIAALPLLLDALAAAPGGAAELGQRAPDVLGKAALGTLLGSYAVTPVVTVTGWRWPVLLRRDLALWTAGFATVDLLLAATLDERGWVDGVAGRAGLATGTLATLLLVPLAVTSNRCSMRLLGRDWKRLHRLITPVLVLVGLHLFLVGSAAFGWAFLGVVAALRLLRVRPVVRWFAARLAVLGLLIACVLAGVTPAVIALTEQGWSSWTDVRPFQDDPDGTRELGD
jgi:sulfoxide reductase heme-binding subunit YedZ